MSYPNWFLLPLPLVTTPVSGIMAILPLPLRLMAVRLVLRQLADQRRYAPGEKRLREALSCTSALSLNHRPPGHLLHPGRGLALVESGKAIPGDVGIIAPLSGNGNEAPSPGTGRSFGYISLRGLARVPVRKKQSQASREVWLSGREGLKENRRQGLSGH